MKIVVIPKCSVCEKDIDFNKTALKCKECHLMCHKECRNLMPTPCAKKFTGTIADYTPTSPPMVPALIVHCINEIEQRGLNELDIYRILGSEKDVKGLKEKFLTSRLAPYLKEVDIHAICGCLKDFLQSLTEPILNQTLWHDFVTAIRSKDPNDVAPALYETIYLLPQPNRDTLAFVILHLQKVAQSPECKMPTDNLAKIFGHTIVGCSSGDPDQFAEESVEVMAHLLNIPDDFWTNFIKPRSE
ncbi:unnamed protein product [Psylliodes chrysocephalus]|uniref:Rac GTPase-activating protein 1 n=1 Tax=Psylliodes chrysocephalus TaxID=3402493 RepID=A0A9P0D2R7_9CUCU|nr:unnamed protein product [Psylliodes chrysocephala]